MQTINTKPKALADRINETIARGGLEALTLSERSAISLTWLFMETNCGGFDQFFSNDSGRLATDALRGLEMVGAQNSAEILSAAMAIFPDGVVPIDRSERIDFLCDSISEEQERLLSDLTRQFFQSPDKVATLVDAYVLAHPEEFPSL